MTPSDPSSVSRNGGAGPRVAVIGGGLAGLTAAWRLQRGGASVTVFEQAESVGGRMATHVLDGCRVDSGAQLFGSMYTEFLNLVRTLGLSHHLVRARGRDALWRNGRIHEVVYGSVTSMAASGGLPFGTKMRLGTRYVPFLARYANQLDVHAPELAAAAGFDDETIASWGRRELDDDFVRSLVYPQLGAYYGSLPEETSAGFYHILARYGMDVTLYGIRGGAGVVPERLAEAVASGGGEVRLTTPVERLALDDGAATVFTNNGPESFDAAVSAVAAPVLLGMAEGLPAALRRWLEEVRYRPFFSLALLLDQPLGGRFFGLSFPKGETRYVAAVCVQEAKGTELVPPGRGVLVAFPTPESTPSLIEATSRDVLDQMLPEIIRCLPGLEGRVARARVYRWPVGTPVFYPGYLSRLATLRSEYGRGSSRLALAGDYLYGPSVEGAVVSGMRAADRILDVN